VEWAAELNKQGEDAKVMVEKPGREEAEWVGMTGH